ncbi:butyrophilin subfamily 1 member A1 [Patagioenas fasciata monilis]|uniref:Butyrophilin subfamily 1 member A1 n=1 Tax=Patagioenas fasciata monilis TaxID=372326 RepID=A0A1V4J6W5_PATFA|nr:butyrophilin subfamily 1 member A1 [Patagioenas fasciata monilis]
MLEYVGRTELWKDGLAKGSVNLKIFHVQLSDRGIYTCLVVNGSDYDQAVVELQVTDPFFGNTHPSTIVLAIVSVVVVALLIFAVYLFKIKARRDAALRFHRGDDQNQLRSLDGAEHRPDARAGVELVGRIRVTSSPISVPPGCAPVKMMLSSFHSYLSLLFFIVYGLVFQVHELHSALLKVMGPPGPVIMAMGEDAVLPCRFSPAQSTQDMEVTWFREQLLPFVHRYKGGRDQSGNQMLEYVGRTELWKDGLAKGSVNLTIFRVQLSDRGNYTCLVVNGSDYDQAVVELQVTGLYSVLLTPLIYLLVARALLPCPPQQQFQVGA